MGATSISDDIFILDPYSISSLQSKQAAVENEKLCKLQPHHLLTTQVPHHTPPRPHSGHHTTSNHLTTQVFCKEKGDLCLLRTLEN